jgi:hypothetical protein
VQAPGEVENLEPHFKDIEFVTTDKLDPYFGSTYPRIQALIEQCSPGIIINSDIELTYTALSFRDKYLTPPPSDFIVGVRLDVSPDHIEINKYGIDVFRIYKEYRQHLADNEFTIGQPGWDYWVLLILAKYYRLVTYKDHYVVHEAHGDRYAPEKIGMAHKVLTRLLKTAPKQTSGRVLKLTGRRR